MNNHTVDNTTALYRELTSGSKWDSTVSHSFPVPDGTISSSLTSTSEKVIDELTERIRVMEERVEELMKCTTSSVEVYNPSQLNPTKCELIKGMDYKEIIEKTPKYTGTYNVYIKVIIYDPTSSAKLGSYMAVDRFSVCNANFTDIYNALVMEHPLWSDDLHTSFTILHMEKMNE